MTMTFQPVISPCLTVKVQEDIVENIGQVFLADIAVSRPALRTDSIDTLKSLAQQICEVARSREIIFTAFDGDHQHLCPYMRRVVLAAGGVPANADSILGYKDTVEAHVHKASVLLDDLAILRSCDQLWVFTDCTPDLTGVNNLAEGILVELLYFLRSGKGLPKFVGVSKILRGGDIMLHEFAHSYDETIRAIDPLRRDKLAAVVSQAVSHEPSLPTLAFHICDPLDFKYAHWLRSRAYGWDRLPLVPGLAIEMADFPPTTAGLGHLVLTWARLAALASEAWWFDGAEINRPQSAIAKLLRECWSLTRPENTVIHKRWPEYPIPKAHIGPAWSIVGSETRDG